MRKIVSGEGLVQRENGRGAADLDFGKAKGRDYFSQKEETKDSTEALKYDVQRGLRYLSSSKNKTLSFASQTSRTGEDFRSRGSEGSSLYNPMSMVGGPSVNMGRRPSRGQKSTDGSNSRGGSGTVSPRHFSKPSSPGRTTPSRGSAAPATGSSRSSRRSTNRDYSRFYKRDIPPVCGICYEPLSAGPKKTLPCKHVYHVACLKKQREFMSFVQRQECPVCPAPPSAGSGSSSRGQRGARRGQ